MCTPVDRYFKFHITSSNILLQDDRFPKGTGIEGANVQSVVCLPVAQPTGDLVCKYMFMY